MKLQTASLLILGFMFIACNNDDDINQESFTSLEGATATIVANQMATIDLSSGDAIATLEDQFAISLVYDNTFIGIFSDRIVRSGTTDLAGDQIWEVAFSDAIDTNRTISPLAYTEYEGVLYYGYRISNTITFESIYFLEALDLTNGNILWTAWETEEFRRLAIINNTLIAIHGTTGNSNFTSRNVTDGTIMNTWVLPERVSHLIPADNQVVVMSWSNAIYSISEDLSVNWSFTTNNSNVRRGTVVDNQFIFHSRDQNIYALDLQLGILNWSKNLPDLFTYSFYKKNNSVWSVTRDFSENRFQINELNTTNGDIISNFIIPASPDDYEIEILPFDDYLLIVSDINTGASITQLYNYSSQNLIWQNEIVLNNISIIRSNILLENTKYTATSF